MNLKCFTLDVRLLSFFRRRICWQAAGMALLLALPALAQDKTSAKQFPPIVLANHFSCQNTQLDLDLGCGFLLRHNDQMYAVSAKHILEALKLKGVHGVEHVCLEGPLKAWTMFSKQDPTETVTLGALLNEDRREELNSAKSSNADWLVFQITTNASQVKPLEIRQTPLRSGEKLFVVGWTNGQTNGPQRTYEYEYYKTIGTRILLKEVIVPEKMGGLSGAPVVDANRLLVGIVSNGTVDPDTGRKMFSPCMVAGLAAFLEKMSSKQ